MRNKQITGTNGDYELRFKYDKKGNKTELANYDKNGQLAEDKDGIAVYRWEYDKYGNETGTRRFGITNDQLKEKNELDQKVSKFKLFEFTNVDIRFILKQLAKQYHLNIVFSESVKGLITVHLENVTMREILDTVITLNGFVYTIKRNVIKVSAPQKAKNKLKQENSQSSSISLDAEIYLKNGAILTGRITEKTKEGVYLETLDGRSTTFISNDDVEKIKKVKGHSNERSSNNLQKGYDHSSIKTKDKDAYCENNQKAIGYIQNAKFIYRDITATYSELSITYAFTYENPEFVGWETSPDPNNPVATLVTIKFRVTGVLPDILNAPESEVSYLIKQKMKEAVPLLRITWRVNDLINLKITPYNFYAKDAIEIYKDIVGGLHKLEE